MLKKIMNDRFWIFIVLLYHERDQKSFKFASTTSDSAICLKDFNKAIAYVYRDIHKEIFLLERQQSRIRYLFSSYACTTSLVMNIKKCKLSQFLIRCKRSTGRVANFNNTSQPLLFFSFHIASGQWLRLRFCPENTSFPNPCSLNSGS